MRSFRGGRTSLTLCQTHESLYKNPHYFYESISQKSHHYDSRDFNLRLLDCFDFLQKSRNDGVGGIIIARFANAESQKSKYSVIARKFVEFSWQSIFAILKLLALRLLCANLNIIHLIRYWFIYFSHCLKSFALDTSLHNATLSMTKDLDCFALTSSSLAMTKSFDCFGESLNRLAKTIRRGFANFTQFIRFATSYTTFKGFTMQT